jgi:hypothetical protein
VLVPNLATFQALVARVEMLEQQVASLFEENSAGQIARNTLESAQYTIFGFVQMAFQRLDDGGL